MCALRRTLTAAAVLGAGLGTAKEASAQYFYVDRLQISGAPDDGYAVWRPHMNDQTIFYGFGALGYSLRPLRKTTVARTATIANQMPDSPILGQFNAYFVLGTQIAERWSVNVALPILLDGIYGQDPQPQGVGVGGIGDSKTSLYDVRLDTRLRLLESNDGKFQFGVGGALWFDAGDSAAFASDDTTTGFLYAAGEYDFGKVLLTGMIGPQFRRNRSIGGPNGALGIGDELRFAVGGFVPLKEGKMRVGAEIFGSTGVEPVEQVKGQGDQNTFLTVRNTPIEWLGEFRMALDRRQRTAFMAGAGTRLSGGYGAPDFRVLVSIGTYLTLEDFEPKQTTKGYHGGEPKETAYAKDTDHDGYPDDIDKCPTIPEDHKPPDPSDGCPAGSDRDHDGIPDDADACPDVPEDKDGVQDNDGCPETDADNDKVPDTEDKCPTEPGPRSKIAEKNGCPQLTKVTAEGEVATMEPIQFEFGKATIKPVSYPILDEVVTLMKSRGKMRIGVYGHTDNAGADDLNLRLSKARAASVMQYLVSKGINANRLESEGFGKTKPVASNDTAEGRAKNRRVEFKILSE